MTANGAVAPPAARPARLVPRIGILVVVAGVLVAAGLADRPAGTSAAAPAAVAMPIAAPPAALSSSWFCAGAIGQPAHQADGRLVVANAGSRALKGTVTVIPSAGPPTTQAIAVGADNRVTVVETAGGSAPYIAAVVALDGGQAAVQQVVAGPDGATSSTPCATTGSNSWYFPAGTTQEAATLQVSLLNPYPDDAIADLSFTTEQGQENPQDFQGIVIPANHVVGLDLGSHLRRRAAVATTVKLRVGRVAAFATQVVHTQSQAAAAAAPPGTVPWTPGLSVVLGSPSPGTTWWWPDGAAGDGFNEQYVIYNPGAAEARVTVSVDLDQGSSDPFQLTVDPHSVVAVVSNSESRIPKGVGHAVTLRSTNGVGVIAERMVQAVAPAPQTGLAQVPGSRLLGRHWLLPGTGIADGVTQSVVIYNPGTAPVSVAVKHLSDGQLLGLSGSEEIRIAPNHRFVVAADAQNPNPALSDAVVIESSGPVAALRSSSPVKGPGIDESLGVPLDQ